MIGGVNLVTTMGIQGNGLLAVYEVQKEIPFSIARAFVVKNVAEGGERGRHAHKVCWQALICLEGRIQVVCDDGQANQSYLLDSVSKILVIPPGIWASQRYLDRTSVLLVLASHPYDEDDYIRTTP